jgi:outer membrane protein assembly factor BamD
MKYGKAFMRYIALTCLTLFFVSCSSEDILNQQIPEIQLADALKLYKNDDLAEAKQEFYNITIRFAGTEVGETAQYYLAETETKMEKYLLAAFSYKQVYDRYKQSEYSESAQYKEAKSYELLAPSPRLDQEYTLRAIKLYTDFIADRPTSKLVEECERSIYNLRCKLAEKMYENARIYYKIEKWNASFKYIEIVKQRYEDTPILLDTYLLRVKIFIEKEEWVQAEQELEITRNKFPDRLPKHPELTELMQEIADGKLQQLNG